MKCNSKKDAENEAKKMLEKFGLEDRMDYVPYKLSGGLKRKLCLALALIVKPKVTNIVTYKYDF